MPHAHHANVGGMRKHVMTRFWTARTLERVGRDVRRGGSALVGRLVLPSSWFDTRRRYRSNTRLLRSAKVAVPTTDTHNARTDSDGSPRLHETAPVHGCLPHVAVPEPLRCGGSRAAGTRVWNVVVGCAQDRRRQRTLLPDPASRFRLPRVLFHILAEVVVLSRTFDQTISGHPPASTSR